MKKRARRNARKLPKPRVTEVQLLQARLRIMRAKHRAASRALVDQYDRAFKSGYVAGLRWAENLPGRADWTARIREYRDAIENGTKRIGLIEQITLIDPIDTPFFSMAPKVKAKDTYHQWVTDVLKPVTEQRLGWWIRIPYGWFLSLKKVFKP